MTIYKGYLKIISKNKGLVFMYMAIFFAVTLIFQSASQKDSNLSYQAESIKIALIDEDKGEFSKSFQEYLRQFHQVTMVEDNKAFLQENLFYRNIEYIVRIPADFYQVCGREGEKLAVTKVPGSYSAFYVDQQINDFLNHARTYYAAGFTEKETALAMENIKSARVMMYKDGDEEESTPPYAFYFQYMPYLFLTVLCYTLGNVLSSFRKGELPKRMMASAVPARRQSLEGLLAAGTVGILLWTIALFIAGCIFRSRLLCSNNLGYYLLNSLGLLLVSLSLSYLVGTVTNGINALNGVVNVIALGMCFLCGVFVPMEYLNQGVKKAAHFLPVYWYENANNLLSKYSTIMGEVKVEVLQSIGIQFVFTIALICVTLAISKKRQIR